jgi:hypothetical protein
LEALKKLRLVQLISGGKVRFWIEFTTI